MPYYSIHVQYLEMEDDGPQQCQGFLLVSLNNALRSDTSWKRQVFLKGFESNLDIVQLLHTTVR